MAGSWDHLHSTKRGFTFDLIENMKDAGECIHECVYLIWKLSNGDMKKVDELLEEYYKACRGEIPEEKFMKVWDISVLEAVMEELDGVKS